MQNKGHRTFIEEDTNRVKKKENGTIVDQKDESRTKKDKNRK